MVNVTKIMFYGAVIAMAYAGAVPVVFAQPTPQAYAQLFKVRDLRTVQGVRIHKGDFEQSVKDFRNSRSQFLADRKNIENRREVLIRSIETLMDYTKILRRRVDKFTVIDQDLERSIIAEIDADSAKLAELKTRADEAVTSEELRVIAVELREHRMDVTERKVRKLMLLAQIGVYEHGILKMASARAENVEKMLDMSELEGNNADLQKKLLEEAQTRIKTASAGVLNLKKEISTKDINKQVLVRARLELRSVQDSMKAVYGIFRGIARGVQL